MGTGFHDLRVWQEAKALAVAVYRATEMLRDFGLRDQIRRAAVSVPSIIAEGDERDTDKDSVRCFYIAKARSPNFALNWKLPLKSERCLMRPANLSWKPPPLSAGNSEP